MREETGKKNIRTIAKIFPNLMKTINPQIKKLNKTQVVNTKDLSLDTIVTLENQRQKILKATRENISGRGQL